VLANAIGAIGRALVFLEVERGGEVSCATGYVASREGLVLTAGHVVRDATSVRGRLLQGGGRGREGIACEVLESDPAADLALLRLRPETRAAHGFEAVPLYRGAPVALGREVAFMGFPHADIFDPPLAMAVRGIVGNRYALAGVEYLVVDAMATEGMSGGPLFMADSGEVIGTVGSRFDPARTRAKLRGLPAAVVAGLPKERTNLTFASGGQYALALLARAGAR
jgi:S1-C subfamily serine protease